MTKLEEQFQKAFLNNCEEAQMQCDCRLKRMIQQAEKYGAVSVAKQLLQRNRLSDDFEKMQAAGLIHLTLEALVVKGDYAGLFTDDEVNQCYETLCEYDYYGTC